MDEEYESLPKPKAKKTKKNIADSDLQYDDEDSKRPDSSAGGITNSDQILVDQTSDLNKIYAFGDNNKLLVFNVGQMMWTSHPFDNNSSYDGTLKYMASCATPYSDTQPYQRRIYLSGGCFTNNAYPSSMFFELQPKTITKPVKRKNMLLKRYGHCMVYLNGAIYAIGGFSHKDLPNEVPVTLASCERYSVHDNSWQYVSTMNESRSFATCVTLDN